MDGRSRKRQASDTSLGHSDVPKTKRKKKAEKSSHSSDLSSTSMKKPKSSTSVVTRPQPALYTPHPSQITESHPLSHSTLQPSKSASKVSSKSKKSASDTSKSTTSATASKDKSAEIKSERRTSSSHVGQTSSGAQSSTTNTSGNPGSSSKPARPRKKNHLKPQNGSWKAHIASIVVYRCVGQALAQSFDPRGSLKEFNWDVLTDGLLTPDDLKMVWFFIEREYRDMSLEDVSEDLKPFSKLTMEPFLREEVKEKYKGEVPKPPVSAYLLFCKSKGPKLKEKHPELTRPQMAQTLGKRWKSMEAEKQAKYKQQYSKLREEYTAKLARFYEEHPDAKPSAYRSRRRNDSKDVYLTPEERRLKMLKSECPKSPLSAYMLFCKAKREKVHKKHPEMTAKEVTVKLSKRWKSMGEEDKVKYKRMQLESSNIYKEQLKKFYEKYPDAKELLKRKRTRKDSGSGSSATKTAIRRDSHDTFYSSDEESPLSPVHHAHTNKGAGREGERSSSDEGSSSSEDEQEQEEEGRNKVKGGRGVDSERGGKGDKSESESESESSSSEDEEEGVGGKKQELHVVGKSRSKEKVVSTPIKKSLAATVSHSSLLKTTAGSSKTTLLSSRSTPSKKVAQSSSSSESEDSGEETDLSDFI